MVLVGRVGLPSVCSIDEEVPVSRLPRVLVWAVAPALVTMLVVVPGAAADPGRPTTPSAADVAKARAEAADSAAALARAAAAQADAERSLALLDAQVELAVERWNAARGAAADAAKVLTAARAVAASAQARADVAQVDVDRLAAASYQVGADLSGGMGEWAAVLDSVFRPDGIQGLADRVSAIGQVAADRRQGIVSAQVLRLAALQAEQSAVRAEAEFAARAATVAEAAAAVQAQQVAQRTEVARLVAVRDAAAATLAASRSTAENLAAARAAALKRAAAEAARAKARAEAERLARERARRHPGPGPRDPEAPTGSWPQGSSSTTVGQRLGALAYARAQLGDPYVAGEAGPDAFDCSGLTSAAYRSVGVPMIQYSQAQFAAYKKIPVAALQPGDLVFFAWDPSDVTTIHHVGIYSGGGQMIEAPHTGDVVKYFTIWQDGLVAFGTRP
jgi:cell wall-associated NlpC family hydrolase